jgi:hypothetical protein
VVLLVLVALAAEVAAHPVSVVQEGVAHRKVAALRLA